MSNYYDEMNVNISELFSKKYLNSRKRVTFFKRLVNRYFAGLLVKLRLYERLVDSGFIRGWFEEFNEYWSIVLKGRPLYFGDFNFLMGNYRKRFQNLETPENSSTKEFLDSWQSKNSLYMLFGAVRRYSLRPFFGLYSEKYIKNGDTVLEYGCGLSPFTNFFLNYSKRINLKLHIADIQQITSHYAKFKFSKDVEFIEITPYQNPIRKRYFNCIILITVMEHLPDPLETIKNITNSLNKNGVLIMDYILGDGEGQDTIEAVKERKVVLKFLEQNYKVLEGKINYNESMGKTVLKKII